MNGTDFPRKFDNHFKVFRPEIEWKLHTGKSSLKSLTSNARTFTTDARGKSFKSCEPNLFNTFDDKLPFCRSASSNIWKFMQIFTKSSIIIKTYQNWSNIQILVLSYRKEKKNFFKVQLESFFIISFHSVIQSSIRVNEMNAQHSDCLSYAVHDAAKWRNKRGNVAKCDYLKQSLNHRLCVRNRVTCKSSNKGWIDSVYCNRFYIYSLSCAAAVAAFLFISCICFVVFYRWTT